MAIMDSIAAQRARVEELNRSVQVQSAKRDQYAAIISQHSLGIFLLSCCLFVFFLLSYMYASSKVCLGFS